MYKIYCLVSPEDYKPFYIGQTRRNIEKRLQEHLVYLTEDSKCKTIKQLMLSGLSPSILVLEETFCTSSEAAIAELFWFEIFRLRGISLTNIGLFFNDKPHYIDQNKYEEGDPFSAWQDEDSSIKTPLDNKPVNHGLPWTELEDMKISAAYKNGITIEEISIEHKRSRGSIHSRLCKLGLISPLN